jgi:hypothetical protein
MMRGGVLCIDYEVLAQGAERQEVRDVVGRWELWISCHEGWRWIVD